MKSLHLKFSLFLFLLAGATALLSPDQARAGKCGLGCQESMGSCLVKAPLWNALETTGYRDQATSCCRSEEYNRRLRSCGYQPAKRSAHMSGNAIDLSVSPKACRNTVAKKFQQEGVSVCPYYHAAHCHVAICGSESSRKSRMNDAGRRATGIRQKNRGQSSSYTRQSPRYSAKKKRPAKRYAASSNWNPFDQLTYNDGTD